MTDVEMREAVHTAAGLLASVLEELNQRQPGRGRKRSGNRRSTVAPPEPQPAPAPEAESLLALAARLKVTRQTIARWIETGVAVGGQRVKLAARRIGGRWMITREAWEQFEQECNPAAPTLPKSPAQCEREQAAARRAFAEI